MGKLEVIKGSVQNLEIAKAYDDLAEVGVQAFTCTVDGVMLAGHFYKIGFKEDETIEFIVENTAEGVLVQAARSPVQRMLWMLPYQTRGHIAQKRSDIKWSLVLSFTIAAAGTSYFYLHSPHLPDEPIWFTPATFLFSFLGILFVNFMVRWQFFSCAVQATDVLAAYGYDNPASVDLPALHKVAEKKWCKETGEYPALYQPWRFRY